jgi:hypothetical protein
MPEILKSCMPELSNDLPSLPFPQGCGLGFHLTKVDPPGMRSAGTGNWAGLFNTYCWIDRSAGVGGAIMTQVLPLFDAKVVEALLGFEVAVYTQVGAAIAPSVDRRQVRIAVAGGSTGGVDALEVVALEHQPHRGDGSPATRSVAPCRP